MKKTFIIYSFLCLPFLLQGQNLVKSYVISVDDGKVYLDVTIPEVKTGDVFSIYEEAGYMVHPVTKKKIKKEGTIVADLEIVEVFDEYSVATVYPENAISKIKGGMIAEMHELPQEHQKKNISSFDSKVQAIVVPKDADGIVLRYLQATGLYKWAGKTFPAYYMEKQILSMDKKGKEVPYSSLAIADPAARKSYVKMETSRGNLLVTYSYAVVVNGNEGWVKPKKGMLVKLRQKDIQKHWEAFENVFDMQCFDTSKWSRKLGETRMEQGQSCTGIEFNSLKNGQFVKMYFSDETGLILYMETKDVKVNCLQYKRYGDLLLCSNSVKCVLTERRELQESMDLQEFIIDYPVDNIPFSKEMVKNAFE